MSFFRKTKKIIKSITHSLPWEQSHGELSERRSAALPSGHARELISHAKSKKLNKIFIFSLLISFSCLSQANTFCEKLQPLVEQRLLTHTHPAYPYVWSGQGPLHQGQVMGAIVGLYIDGKTCYYSFGHRRLNSPGAPTPTTLFEIGSLTKIFTATLISAETQHYHLNLNSPIQNAAPSFFHLQSSTLSFSELATHSAGLMANPPAIYAEYPYSTAHYSEKNFLELINHSTLHPGHYCYSNVGYALLGQIGSYLATGSYQHYDNAIQRIITQPLHMYHTKIKETAHVNYPAAEGYTNCLGSSQCTKPIFEIPAWPTSTPLDSSIALQSDAKDLMLFIKTALGDNTQAPLFIRSAIAATFIAPKPYIVIPGWPHHVQALAWEMQLPDKNRDLEFTKNGSTFGFSSIMALDMNKKIGLLVLTNTNNAYDCEFYNKESYAVALAILHRIAFKQL